MNNNFDPSNAVAVNQTSQGTTPADTGSFSVDRAVPVDETNNGNTSWENFKQSTNTPSKDPTDQELEDSGQNDYEADRKSKDASNDTLKANKGQPSVTRETSKGVSGSWDNNPEVKEGVSPSGKRYNTIGSPDYPPEDWLNATGNIAAGMVWQNFIKPVDRAMGKPTQDMDDYVNQLEKKHPLATIAAGTAPFLVSAPFLPESLVPNIYLRMSAQMGLVGLGAGINKAQEDKSKQFIDKVSDVAGETLKQMAYGPVFAKAHALQILDRPFASALARAGVIASGSGVVSTVFGDNVVEAFKQSGIYGVLSLLTESPHLAKTTIARGVIAHMNDIRAQQIVKSGLPDQPEKTENGLKDTGIETPQAKEIEQSERRKTQVEGSAKKRLKDWTEVIDQYPTDESKKYHISRLPVDDAIKGRLISHYDNQSKWPVIDPDSPDVAQQAHDAALAMAKKVPGINKPQIVAATIKLPDGTKIHGVSHEDALNKIGNFKVGLFRGESAKNLAEDMVNGKHGVSLTKNKKMAEAWASLKGDNFLSEYSISNSAKILPWESIPKEWITKGQAGADYITDMDSVIKYAKDNNYDAIDMSKNGQSEIRVINKNVLLKGKYQAGFTVMDPDGTTKFITREESMKSPFNLPTGHSEDVKGLNESKFMPQEYPIKIVNPDTLERIKSNEGKMDSNLIPFKAEIAENLARAYQESVKTFVPPDVSEPSKFTGMSMRQWLGLNARNEDRFMDAMREARKIFEKMSKEDIIKTYTKAQRGEKQDNDSLQKIYDTLQQSLLDLAKVVQSETGKLQELIDNYLPQAWEDSKKAQNAFRRIMGKRPLGGPKSFLKKRTINDFEEGIEKGLTPISWNPVDLTMFKLREMNRFLMENRVRKALRSRGFEYFLRVGGERKAGTEDWVKIKDSGSDVYKSPMIAIQEAYDEHVMTALNNVAKSLGIDVERLVKMRGGKAWGSSQRGLDDWPEEGELVKGQAQPGKIKTKFAGPTSVLAHEIGHQIDEMQSGKDRFIPEYTNMILDQKIKALDKNEAMSDEERKDAIKQLKFSKKRNNELNALADLRYEGKQDVSDSFKKYVRKGSEKMAVMLEAYIHAPNKFKESAPELFKRFDEFIKSKPELKPLSDIEPSLVLGTNKAEIYAGGNVIAGHWLTHPDAARIVDNYLSPGLRGDYFYDIWRSAGNSLIQARLSLSAFHSQFVSNDANISHFALGLNKLASGDVNGFKNIALSGLGPIPVINPSAIQTLVEGRKMMESWNGKDNGPVDNMIAELYARGGGRAKMDKFWAIESDKAMAKSLKEGKYMTGVLHTPFWILQQMNRPLLEYYVPRMKMGVFANLMKFELKKNPNITQEELLGKAQKAVDAVDDRMGQLVYDNLFLNKTLKDIGMGSVQSFGWNVGDVRLFGGGSIDLMKNLNDLRQGKGTELGYRLAYVLAMPMVMGWYGAIYQYLHTGKYPGQGIEKEGMAGVLKDLYFPRNGGYDPRGQESRSSLASYIRDIYHFAQDPVRTVIDKLNPLGSEVLNQYQNKNFYGVKIYNEDDGLVQQLIDRVSDGVASNLPYSFQNSQRNPVKGIEPKVENFLGYGIAPYDINMTSAEKEAYNLSIGNMSPASRTKEQSQHSQGIAKLRSQYLADKDDGPLSDAVDQGVISNREKKQIIKEAKMTNMQRLTKGLTFEQTFHVLNKGNPTEAEKAELEEILDKKRDRKETEGKWTDAEEKIYARAVAMAN